MNCGRLAPLDPLSAEADAEAFASVASLQHVQQRFAGERVSVHVASVEIGPDTFTVIAGPCAVENERQVMHTAEAASEAGANILRGGGFKPRTSPYSFQGLERDGLKLLRQAGDAFGLPIVSEAMTDTQVPIVAEYADMLQVGARSMYNAALLAAVGRCGRPVLLKRGMTASVEELLQSAELIAATGNSNIVLCERGIRTYGRLTRNTCDLGAVAVLNLLTRLPVIVDPSHATGQTVLVPVLSRAAVAVGADGLMVEMHPAPKGALSDGLQSLTFDEFRLMMQSLQPYIALRTKNALACESDV